MSRRVHVVSTGGTIASTAAEDGAAPSLSGDELVADVPALADHARVTVESVSQVPGFDVDLGVMDQTRRAAVAAVEDGADGVVVTHGTDTLGETAYYLDATLPDGVPAVVTGAQRRPDEPGADGPANLLAAVRVAAHDRVTTGGFVVFGDDVHPGRDAVKAHSSRPDAFASPDAGPVGLVRRDGVRFFRDPGRESRRLPATESDAEVALVTSGAGVGGRPVERAVADGADGVVLAGTGLGNATGALGRAVADAVAEGVPVVAATRCHAGGVGAVYGTDGGGHTLREAGVHHAGTLAPWKARLKLRLVLAAGADVADYFPVGDDR